MPGVTVTLVHDLTQVAATRVTDDKGRYLFDFVDPGPYTITAELDGFKKAIDLRIVFHILLIDDRYGCSQSGLPVIKSAP